MLHLNSLRRRTERRRTLIDDAFRRVADSGWFILGPETGAFETRFASYMGVGHCVTVANGTDALRLALQAGGVKPGDKVATAANAGMYATTALLALGAQPFFLDVDESTHCITGEEVERAAAAGVAALVATHLYGRVVPKIAGIAAYCRAQDIFLIEDCAQAHGAILDGRHAGSFGNAGCFSFYPTKNLGALGDGGAVVTGDGALADRCRRLRQYGWAHKYKVETAGGANSRMDEIQAAILSALLPHLDADNDRRRAIAARYNTGITANIALPGPCDSAYVAHLYVIRSDDRDGLKRHLESCSISSDIHYPIPDHRQPVFGPDFASIDLLVTERLAGEILSLPCYPEMTDEEVGQVIKAVNSWRS